MKKLMAMNQRQNLLVPSAPRSSFSLATSTFSSITCANKIKPRTTCHLKIKTKAMCHLKIKTKQATCATCVTSGSHNSIASSGIKQCILLPDLSPVSNATRVSKLMILSVNI